MPVIKIARRRLKPKGVRAVRHTRWGTRCVSNTGILNVRGGGTRTLIGDLTNAAGSTLTTFDGTALAVTGTLTHNGGTAAVDALTAGGLAVNGGTFGLRPQPTAGGVSTVGSLSRATDANGTAIGTLDVGNNKLVVAYGSAASPAAEARAWLTSGYNGGAWTGPGLVSSTAAARAAGGAGPLTSVGWADDAAGVLTVMYTLAGDGTLDGTVDGGDLGGFASNYGGSGKTWSQGDYNYDGLVDGADLGLLATNYGQSIVAAPAVTVFGLDTSAEYVPLLDFAARVGELSAVASILEDRGVVDGADVSAAAGVAGVPTAAVPEPATATVAGLVGVAALGRRRRRAA